MMRSTIKKGILGAAVPLLILAACSKYEDPAAPDIDGKLTRHYCNDSKAVNYNWNFPGIADSTVCIYAVDSFLGTWSFRDYVLLPNGDTDAVIDRNLTFVSTEDTVKKHLAVTGWCSGNTPFYITADKYGKAEVDTFPGSALGQFLCVNTDTLNGNFRKTAYASGDSMQVDLRVNNASGTKYHKGVAIKQ